MAIGAAGGPNGRTGSGTCSTKLSAQRATFALDLFGRPFVTACVHWRNRLYVQKELVASTLMPCDEGVRGV